jgi:hypothetical protein
VAYDLFAKKPKRKEYESLYYNSFMWNVLWNYVNMVNHYLTPGTLSREDIEEGSMNNVHLIGEKKAKTVAAAMMADLRSGFIRSRMTLLHPRADVREWLQDSSNYKTFVLEAARLAVFMDNSGGFTIG